MTVRPRTPEAEDLGLSRITRLKSAPSTCRGETLDVPPIEAGSGRAQSIHREERFGITSRLVEIEAVVGYFV